MKDLIIDHNAGFFSCCSVKLGKIVEFFNTFKKIPNSVCCKNQFQDYKTNLEEDLNLFYFKNQKIEEKPYDCKVDFHWDYQYKNYKELDFKNLNFFIEKYFEPSDYIKQLIISTEKKYKINYSKTISVYYRGNDKCKETKIASYEDFFDKCNILKNTEKDSIFLVQSDEIEFRTEFCKLFPNSFFIEEILPISKNVNACPHSYVSPDSKKIFGALMLHMIIILSKCNYIVTHSGNCGLWSVLYRGNGNNIIQFLENKEYDGWI